MIKTSIYIALGIVLILLSIFPRATEVISHNFVFGFDQGRDFLAARSIVANHKPTLIGSEWGAGSAGFTGLFHGPGYFYLLSVAYLLFQGDPYGGVVVMFILGVVTIALGYFLGKRLFGSFGGYLLALLIAISPPLIAQSRFFWNTYPSSPLILIVFYLTFLATSNKKKILFFLAAFFSASIYNFQTAIAIPLCLTLLVYTVLLYKRNGLAHYFSVIAGYLCGFLPLLLFEIRHNFQGFSGITSYLISNSHSPHAGVSVFQLAADHLWTFFYVVGDSFPHTPVPIWLLLVLIVIPLVYLWYFEADRNIRFFLLYLFFIPLVAFVVFMFLRKSVYTYYLQEITFVVLFFFTYLVVRAVQLRKPFILALSGMFLLTISISGSIHAYTSFINDVRDYGGDAKIKGKIDAIDFIYNDARGTPFNLMVFQPAVYTYPYDYLLEWYGGKRYGYTPGSEKKDALYLLIEVDPAKPWSYEGWLETVIKDGTIEKTETLPSGIIIQKRNVL